MLKIMIILSMVSFASLVFFRNGYCVPAKPSPRRIEQPDGHHFDARLWGDENAHGWETTDGYSIVKDPATNYWYYARECTSQPVCSGTHYRVALVQADGDRDLENGANDGDSGDLYPGATHNTEFSSLSLPESRLYDGLQSHVDITDIYQSGRAITASLGLAYTLAPTSTAGGSITPGVESIIDYGGDLTFAISPSAGYQISNILIDGASVGALSEYTFSDTRTDHTIKAVFTATGAAYTGSSASGGGSSGGCFIASAL